MALTTNAGSQDREANEEAPATLTDRLNEWEQDIRGTCEGANATVNETVEGMATIVTDSGRRSGELSRIRPRPWEKHSTSPGIFAAIPGLRWGSPWYSAWWSFSGCLGRDEP